MAQYTLDIAKAMVWRGGRLFASLMTCHRLLDEDVFSPLLFVKLVTKNLDDDVDL